MPTETAVPVPGGNNLCAWHDEEIRTMRDALSDKQEQIGALAGEIGRLAERIPEKLPETLLTLSLKLDRVITDVGNLDAKVDKDFVHRSEFAVLKSEHDLLKRIVQGAVAVILLAVLTAIVALVLERKGSHAENLARPASATATAAADVRAAQPVLDRAGVRGPVRPARQAQ